MSSEFLQEAFFEYRRDAERFCKRHADDQGLIEVMKEMEADIKASIWEEWEQWQEEQKEDEGE